MRYITENQARVALAVRDQHGTSGDIAARAGVNGRTTRKALERLMADGVVRRVPVWPMLYLWTSTDAGAERYREVLASLALVK